MNNKKLVKCFGVLFSSYLFVTYPSYEVKAEESQQSAVSQTINHHEVIKTNNEFIDEISEHALKLAQKYDVYPSVMIAQASLESGYGTSGLSEAPYHNLFGTKGFYEGQGASFATLEEDGSGFYTIEATFRQYPSYYESLIDYCELLQHGITDDEDFYKGTWRSETASYQEATEYLTGRYATDTHYNEKLNSVIEQFDLTKFDEWLETEIKLQQEKQIAEQKQAAVSQEEAKAKRVKTDLDQLLMDAQVKLNGADFADKLTGNPLSDNTMTKSLTNFKMIEKN